MTGTMMAHRILLANFKQP